MQIDLSTEERQKLAVIEINDILKKYNFTLNVVASLVDIKDMENTTEEVPTPTEATPDVEASTEPTVTVEA